MADYMKTITTVDGDILRVRSVFKTYDGCRFGRWTVIGVSDIPYGQAKNTMLQCECDCGTVRPVKRQNLLSGASTQCQSCGLKYARLAKHEKNIT